MGSRPLYACTGRAESETKEETVPCPCVLHRDCDDPRGKGTCACSASKLQQVEAWRPLTGIEAMLDNGAMEDAMEPIRRMFHPEKYVPDPPLQSWAVQLLQDARQTSRRIVHDVAKIPGVDRQVKEGECCQCGEELRGIKARCKVCRHALHQVTMFDVQQLQETCV